MGCRLCELACLTSHSGHGDLATAYINDRPAGLSPRRKVVENGEECVSIGCRHCDEPLCISACISGALIKNAETGITVYEPSLCVGCWACVMACPYGAVRRNNLENTIIKCDLCTGRENGPACVEACPNKALRYEER
ncbi:4Fe-4S dicluster domain-containing protein [Maridesulfovibrio sp.]|uniref:4Fe-4S dicluster domain-containing protein n=1 Tax=Maridesulfovibrio sp. TaxID=2795000 RepID=UPI002A18B98F|nr:4Fe-4S dicluster domain-containing protein [Maridesulfovibrio sp.]